MDYFYLWLCCWTSASSAFSEILKFDLSLIQHRGVTTADVPVVKVDVQQWQIVKQRHVMAYLQCLSENNKTNPVPSFRNMHLLNAIRVNAIKAQTLRLVNQLFSDRMWVSELQQVEWWRAGREIFKFENDWSLVVSLELSSVICSSVFINILLGSQEQSR